MPAAPPEPRYWFSHVVDGCRISALIFAACGRVSEARHHGSPPALTHPHGQARVEGIAAGRVGIQVCRYIQPLDTRAVEALQHRGHAAPVLRVGGLQVMHDGRHAGLAGDAEHLVEALVDGVGFGALVRDVAAAVASRHARHGYQFLGAREAVGHILQGRGHAKGASLHGGGHLRLHGGQFDGCCGAVVAADHRIPHAASADERAQVDGGGALVEHREVARQVGPRRHAFLVEHRREGMELARAIVGGTAEARLAGELGRDALHDLAADAAVAQHPVFRLAEPVDEARRHHQAARV